MLALLSRLEQAEQDAYGFREGYEILKRALIKQGEHLEQAEQAVQRVRAMAQDWEANGNSCAVGDRSADVWHATANAILRALDGDARRCIECNGTGDVQVRFNHGIQTQDCAVCFGTGDGRG